MKTSDTPEEQDELTSMWNEPRDYDGNRLQENRDATGHTQGRDESRSEAEEEVTMDETPREPVMVWQFVRRHFVRIVIGVVLVAVVSTIVFVWMPYRREQRVARKIESIGGYVSFEYVGPTWVPLALENRLPIWNRVDAVILENQAVPSDVFSELETLTNPYMLYLYNSEFTDTGLETLKRLKVLKRLDLRKNRITDAGLEHLKELTSLELIDLNETETTEVGRDMLRKALPNCNIEPNP